MLLIFRITRIGEYMRQYYVAGMRGTGLRGCGRGRGSTPARPAVGSTKENTTRT